MSEKINLSEQDFINFMSILNIFKNTCQDMSIVEGKIFQFNTHKSILYDIDLSSMFGKNTLYFNDVKNKSDILEIFQRQRCAIDIEFQDKKYIISDSQTKVEILKPDPRTLENKPINITNSNAINTTSIDKDKGILNCTIDNVIIPRIDSMSKSLQTSQLLVVIKNNKLNFSLVMGETNNAVVVKLLEFDDCMYEHEGYIQYPIFPFQLKTQSIDCEIYPNMNMENGMTMLLTAQLGEEQQIPVKMWVTNKFKITSK